MNPWSQLLNTALSAHVKQYLYDILKERYSRNEEFIERLSSCLNTSKDVEGMGKLVADLYETGYMKSLQDHRQELETKGFKAVIKRELSEEEINQNRIFPKSK
jgi:hypothetical protein